MIRLSRCINTKTNFLLEIKNSRYLIWCDLIGEVGECCWCQSNDDQVDLDFSKPFRMYFGVSADHI